VGEVDWRGLCSRDEGADLLKLSRMSLAQWRVGIREKTQRNRVRHTRIDRARDV
jgi:hypothetical protein